MIATLVLLILLALANPAAELDRLAYAGRADPQAVAQTLQAGLDELTGDTRPEQCMNAFLAGELYRKADGVAPGLGYQQQALESFRAMRVDFLDLPTGALGYIGEARVHLQNNDPQQAQAVLAPLLDTPGVTKIKRLAEIESLQALLHIEPGHAIAQARQYGELAHWFLAQAFAKQGDTDEALKLVRSEPVIASAPQYHRLKLIAELGALNDAERTAWAQSLVWVGRNDQALAVLREHAPAESLTLYATLLQQAGDIQAAATQWQNAIDNGAGPQAQLAYAACLESMIDNDPTQKPAALQAYQQVFESDADDAIRRDALRRWVHLHGLDNAGPVLDTHDNLVASDPYLRYTRAALQSGTAKPESIITELKAIADETDDPAVHASAILLHAQISPSPREALNLIEEHWNELMQHSALADRARARRVGLWIELGVVDRAVDQLLNAPDAQPAELLPVAQALADRYANGIAGSTQQRVLQLTAASLAAAPDDQASALQAAKLLRSVGANADAITVLRSLNMDEAKPILAQALRETGRPQEAVDTLSGIDTPDAALQRGLALLDLNQVDRALAEVRAARKSSSPGSDAWWDATLALVTVQINMNDLQAAEEVLRVAEALYPVNTRPQIRTKLQAIKKELQS